MFLGDKDSSLKKACCIELLLSWPELQNIPILQVSCPLTFHLTRLCVCPCTCLYTLTFHFADEETEIKKWLNQCHIAYCLVRAEFESRSPDQMPSQTHLLLLHSVQQTVWGFSGKALCQAEQLTAKYRNLLSRAPHVCLLRP